MTVYPQKTSCPVYIDCARPSDADAAEIRMPLTHPVDGGPDRRRISIGVRPVHRLRAR